MCTDCSTCDIWWQSKQLVHLLATDLVCRYDYDPETASPNNDGRSVELPLLKNQVVTVFGECDGDGFFEGEVVGRRGLVASNFVEDLPQDLLKVKADRSELRRHETDLETALTQHQQLENQIKLLQNELQGVEEQLHDKDKQLEQKQQENFEMLNELESWKHSNNTNSLLEKHLQAAREEITEQQKLTATATDQLTSAHESLDQCRAREKEMSSAIFSLEGRLAETESERRALQDAVYQFRDTQGQTSSDLQELQQRLLQSQQARESLVQDHSLLRDCVLKQIQAGRDLQHRIAVQAGLEPPVFDTHIPEASTELVDGNSLLCT